MGSEMCIRDSLNVSELNYEDLSSDNLEEVKKFEPFITRLEKNDFDGILD